MAGAWVVPRVKEKGTCLNEMYHERGMIVGNALFKKRRKNTYNRKKKIRRDESSLCNVLIECELK